MKKPAPPRSGPATAGVLVTGGIAGISIREFAKRDGCDDKLVRRAIAEGHLTKLPSGKLDPALVGTGWRPGNRRAGVVETAAQQAARAVEDATEIPPIADSEAKKEFYLAKLRELEYDLKSGQVSPNAEQIKKVAATLAKVRTRILAIPSEAAPAISRCKSAAEIEAELRRRVIEALEELSSVGEPAAD